MNTNKEKELIGKEIVLLNIEDVKQLTGWSEAIVRRTFKNDNDFPAIKKGKEYQVEYSALKNYFSKRRTNN